MSTNVNKAGTNIDGTLHHDRLLGNFSEAYMQEARNFVAGAATTQVAVSNKSDLYMKLGRGSMWRDEAQARPLNGRPVQAGYNFTEGTYSCVEYALEHLIDDRQRANADQPINLEMIATQMLTQKMMIRQDNDWVSKCFKAGVWSTDLTGVAASPSTNEFLQFNDANSDPVAIIHRERDRIAQLTGMQPNTAVLGSKVFRDISNNPEVLDRIKYTQRAVLTEDLLAALLGVDNVIVARSVFNNAIEGATDDIDWIADETDMWLGYIAPVAALNVPTAVANFLWTGLLPGATNALGGVIERGRDSRAHSDYFQIRGAWDIQIVAPDLGIFFADAVADSAAVTS